MLATFLCHTACGGTSCPDSELTDSVAEGIMVGDNQSVPVTANGSNVPEEFADVLEAIGRMEGIACTGTHIGRHLVLTAAHCIVADAPDDCAGTSIEWGVRQGLPGELVGRCQRVTFAELSLDRDIALFEVDAAPAAEFPIDLCRARGPGDRVSLFGHPERRPLEWSGYCMLESLPEIAVGRARVAHVCDTQSGDSGAPLLDAETLQVVAVHDGAAGSWNQATLLYQATDLFAEEGWACQCESTVHP